MKKSKTTITDLISLRTLQKIQDNFSDALGISVSMRDLNGQLITQISNMSKLWEYIETQPRIKELWSEPSQKAWEECLSTGDIVIYERKAGTYTFTTPIAINGKVMGFFVGGLVRLGNPNMELCKQEAKTLGLELDQFLDLFLQLPLVTIEKFRAAGNLLKVIANTISTLEFEKQHHSLNQYSSHVEKSNTLQNTTDH